MTINKNQYLIISVTLMLLWYILAIFMAFIIGSHAKVPIWYLVGSFITIVNTILSLAYCLLTAND